MKYFSLLLLMSATLAACNQQPSTPPVASAATTSDTAAKAVGDSNKRVLPAGPIAHTIMTEAYVKMMATSIYAWGWPMANLHNRFNAFKNVPELIHGGGTLPMAPPNEVCMLTDYADPYGRAVACPNQDVVYGLGFLDVSRDAVVVQVPDFGDRFWVYQACDQRTDGFAKFGKMYGTKPGFYLIAGKDWNGKVPDGIVETFRCPTKYGVVAPRVFQTDDPADKRAVQPLINGIVVYPLSRFDGKMKTIDWSKIPSSPIGKEGATKGETKWVNPAFFFDELGDILQEVPAQYGEEVFYAQMQAFLEAINKDPKLKKAAIDAATAAEKDLVTPLFQFVNVGYPVKYNWTTQRNGAQFGTDYLTRLACAKANIFVNKPVETRYYYQDRDSSGVRLSGGKGYTVTFANGELPPVKGFWSLTLYSTEHFFVPNQLKRYSLGTKNKDLQTNPDGSLTIYVQSSPPSAGKQSNWLPAPKDAFSLYVRCYWPEQRALDDSWTPPAVVKLR